MDSTHPTFGNGKICYIEIPAMDHKRSSLFYEAVFGWTIRLHDKGHLSFDDGVGEVSGTWVSGRPVATEPGMIIHIMVYDMEDTLQKILKHGGLIKQEVGMDAPEITARFCDPDGNVWGLYQQR